MPGINRQVTLYLAYSALLYIGLIGISDALLNFYFVSLGYGPETIGALQSLPRVGGFLTSVPVGLLANRIGTRRVTILSTGGIVVTYLLVVLYPNLWVLGLSRFLLGLFYGAGQIAAAPLLISLSARAYETHVFAYLNVVSMGATSIGSIIGGYLPLLAVGLFPAAIEADSRLAEQTPFAYQFALIVACVMMAVSILPLLKLVDQDTGYNRHKQIQLWGVPWRSLTWLSLPLLLFGFTGGLTFPFYNLFFRMTFGVPDRTVGTILSLGWLGMALVPLVNPWWDRRFGRARALMITMSIAAGAFFGLSIAPTLAISVAFYVAAISFRNVMQPLYQPLIMDTLSPELRNIASSIGMVLWNIGWFSATAMSGVWQAAYGFGVIMRLVAAGVFLTGVSVVLIFRRTSAHQPAVEEC